MNAAHVFLLYILGATLLSTVLCTSKIIVILGLQLLLLQAIKCLVTAQKGRHICVDPSLPWVENIIKKLDENDLK
ncbi:hypothetical protein ILYODFUR_035338 [Ilyodon furcidens]|uniref:Chemokine interleukin-8-like domain-containing protein n=1 Tax=Ilyodon furcidens TaxID=33524 RepID=A0ABV0TR97_9TELE